MGKPLNKIVIDLSMHKVMRNIKYGTLTWHWDITLKRLVTVNSIRGLPVSDTMGTNRWDWEGSIRRLVHHITLLSFGNT